MKPTLKPSEHDRTNRIQQPQSAAEMMELRKKGENEQKTAAPKEKADNAESGSEPDPYSVPAADLPDEPPATAVPRSMWREYSCNHCTNCGSHKTRIYATERVSKRHIFRRHRCGKCGETWRSDELIARVDIL